MYPEKMLGLLITGSSGLYESAMGDSYQDVATTIISEKARSSFYDP
jgi:hypothetical protein